MTVWADQLAADRAIAALGRIEVAADCPGLTTWGTATMFRESRGSTAATSSIGAVGQFQILPSSARWPDVLRVPEGAAANVADYVARLWKYWTDGGDFVAMPWHAATRGMRLPRLVDDVFWLESMPTRARWWACLRATGGSWFEMFRPAIRPGQSELIWRAAHGG